MFNKLIIAVLTLGLLLTFCSAAISSDVPKVGVNRVETSNPNAPKLNLATPIERPVSGNHKPLSALNQLQTPARVLPPPYVCEYYDYSGGAAAYFWKLTDKYGDSIQGMRFTPREGYNCTLLTAYVGIYGTAIKGNPGMRVTVYNDNGFDMPGVVRGYVDVLAGDLPHTGMYYKAVDISTIDGGNPLVYSNAAQFHIGVSKLGIAGDTLAILSDNGSAGQGRAWEYWFDAYGTMNDDWGKDVNFLLGVDVCCGKIPYTSCYRQEYDCGTTYFWRQPDAYGDDYFNQRFSVAGPETLKAIGIATYRPPAKPWGNPDLAVFVWGDDGTGFPNLSDVIYADTLPWASLVHYPSWNIIPINIVVRQEFHIGWSTVATGPNDTLACLSDAGLCGTGRSSEYWGSWGLMMDDWGKDVNFLMYADLCKDEFSDCRTLSDFDGDYYYWRYPDRYGDISMHQLFTPKGEGCRLEKVSVRFYWNFATAGGWPLYSTNSELQVYTKDGLNNNLPGNKVYWRTIYPADYHAIPPTTVSTRWWATFDVAADNYLFDQDVWIGVESFSPDTLHGFFTLSDPPAFAKGYASAEGWGSGFGYMVDDWGIDTDHGVKIDVCCVPIAECACAPGEDWPTMGKNYARTVHSGNSLGAAQCQWTKAWQYTNAQTMVYNSPVIYKDTVIAYFFDRIVALDINTGAQIWEKLSDPLVIGSAYATPTVENGIIYTAGGSTRAFSALSVHTGAVVWNRDYTVNSNFVTFGPSVIMDVSGTRVVFYADDGGNVYAANALTGANYPGWTPNPVSLGSAINRGLTTDGNLIFVGTDMPDLATSGDIYALDPTDGSIVWQLSVPPAGGYYGPLVVPPKDFGGAEGFTAGISVAAVCNPGALGDNVLYTASYYNIADNTSPVQDGGVLYSINAADGSVNWAALCQQANYNIPAIDAARVIYQDWTPWLNSGQYRGPVGFGRASGNVDWKNTTTNPGWGDGAIMEGLLSCEPDGAADIYAGIYRSNFVNFYLADNGFEIFHRRFTGYLNGLFSKAGHRIAPAMDDGHLLLPWRNKIVCVAPSAKGDRPRLELPHYVIDVPVPFDSGTPARITFADAIRNSGCAGLTINSVVFDVNSNHTEPGLFAALNTVSDDRLDRLNQQTESFNPKTQQRWLSFRDENFRITDEMTGKGISSTEAAFTPPSFIIGLVSPLPGTIVAADVTIPIVVDVDGDAITRGYHAFYATITTNDPDYFLDSALIDKDLPIHGGAYAVPQIQLGLIGGCLYANRILTFGAGGANSEKVWNSGMLANTDSSNNMVINTVGGVAFGGGLVFAKSKYRLALHMNNWHSDPTTWKSLLGDPNCVNQSCSPLISTNVLLGKISTDNGANYANVFGNVISVAFVDSVQRMDDDTSAAMHWNWSYPRDVGLDPPYDDTLTIGFHSCTQYIGALNVPALANFAIHRHAVTSRNHVPITDLYLTAIMDWDITPTLAKDLAGYDAAHSLAYFYECDGKTQGWGMVKIPFGCGYSPLICSQTNSSEQSIFNDSDIWLDSLYRWASTRTGLWHQKGVAPNPNCTTDPSDRGQFINLQKSTIPANDTAVYAYAIFGVTGITNADQASAYFTLANTANQFCGFGRGDVNNDGAINLADIIALAWYVADPVNHPGPYPFWHLGDVNNDGVITDLDVTYMLTFYFNFGACPVNAWKF